MYFEEEDMDAPENRCVIHLERSKIRVSGYYAPKGAPGYLPSVLTAWDSTFKRYMYDKTYVHIDANGDYWFPRGTSLKRITDKMKLGGVENPLILDESNDNLVPKCKMSEEITFNRGVDLLHHQHDVAKFMNEPCKNGMHFKMVTLPPGMGKTVCALYEIHKRNTKTIIVANSLVDQWAHEILSKTTMNYKYIYEISGQNSINVLLRKTGIPKYDIYLATSTTLKNAADAGVFDELMRKLCIGFYIVDEIHVATYTHSFLNMLSNVQDVMYLSATPTRSNPSEAYIFKQAFLNVPKFGEDVEQRNYINVIYVEYNTNPTWKEVNKCQNFYGFQTKRFAEHCFNEENRHVMYSMIEWAINISLGHINSDEKIVIILERLCDVKLVINHLRREYPNINIGDYTSNVKTKEEKVKNLKNTIIVTTDKSFGTGSDLNGLLRILINTTTYNSEITAKQQPKRLRHIPGKEVYYIDFVNTGFKRTFHHFLRRSKIMKTYAKSTQRRIYGKDI